MVAENRTHSTESGNPDQRAQPDKFRDLARELGCDEDEARFEEAVRKLAKAPHVPKESAKRDD